MVSGSGFARGLCLGRSANSRIEWIGNGRKQHQRWSEHNNKQHGYGGFAEQHGRRSDGYRRGSDERYHCGTINYDKSKQCHDRKQPEQSWIDIRESEHRRKRRDDRNNDDSEHGDWNRSYPAQHHR